jgi:hypothetical protein
MGSGIGNWKNPPETFRLRPHGPGASEADFWQEVEALLAQRPAVDAAFVAAVADGSALLESIREFAHDLRALARDLPLIQGEIASRAALHGTNTVILLSQGATLAFGYQEQPPLVELVEKFAKAVGVERSPDEEPSLPASAFLVCVRSLGLEWFEAGVATMLVDRDWSRAAPALRAGLERHYGIVASDLACFDVLAALPGDRATQVPVLLREIARSAYHQHVVTHAVRETVTLWNYLWDGWAPGAGPARLPGPTAPLPGKDEGR